MKVGIPSEVKAQESRVGLTPSSVQELINHGHDVLVQDNAGFGAGFENTDYEKVGAKILPTAGDVFNDSDNLISALTYNISPPPHTLKKNQLLLLILSIENKPQNILNKQTFRKCVLLLSSLICNDLTIFLNGRLP